MLSSVSDSPPATPPALDMEDEEVPEDRGARLIPRDGEGESDRRPSGGFPFSFSGFACHRREGDDDDDDDVHLDSDDRWEGRGGLRHPSFEDSEPSSLTSSVTITHRLYPNHAPRSSPPSTINEVHMSFPFSISSCPPSPHSLSLDPSATASGDSSDAPVIPSAGFPFSRSTTLPSSSCCRMVPPSFPSFSSSSSASSFSPDDPFPMSHSPSATTLTTSHSHAQSNHHASFASSSSSSSSSSFCFSSSASSPVQSSPSLSLLPPSSSSQPPPSQPPLPPPTSFSRQSSTTSSSFSSFSGSSSSASSSPSLCSCASLGGGGYHLPRGSTLR